MRISDSEEEEEEEENEEDGKEREVLQNHMDWVGWVQLIHFIFINLCFQIFY